MIDVTVVGSHDFGAVSSRRIWCQKTSWTCMIVERLVQKTPWLNLSFKTLHQFAEKKSGSRVQLRFFSLNLDLRRLLDDHDIVSCHDSQLHPPAPLQHFDLLWGFDTVVEKKSAAVIRFSSFFSRNFCQVCLKFSKTSKRCGFLTNSLWTSAGQGMEASFLAEMYRRPGLWIWIFQDVLSLESCLSCESHEKHWRENPCLLRSYSCQWDSRWDSWCSIFRVFLFSPNWWDLWLLIPGDARRCDGVHFFYRILRGEILYSSSIFYWDRWLVKWPDSQQVKHKSNKLHKISESLWPKGSRIINPHPNNQGIELVSVAPNHVLFVLHSPAGPGRVCCRSKVWGVRWNTSEI